MAEAPVLPSQEGGAAPAPAATTTAQFSVPGLPSTYIRLSWEAERLNHGQLMEREGNNLVLREDGYEWKKYGQKFIRNISKTRSYFKCRRHGCSAKKKAEWSYSDASNVQITYEGMHTHAPLNSSQAASVARQYDLYNQLFGHQNNPS